MVPFYLFVMSEGQSALGDPVDQPALPIFRGVAKLRCVVVVAVLWGSGRERDGARACIEWCRWEGVSLLGRIWLA
jgi:hypothetical protein